MNMNMMKKTTTLMMMKISAMNTKKIKNMATTAYLNYKFL